MSKVAGKDTVCECKTCKKMCHIPCWPTPDEARALIESRRGHLLMRDWWVGGGPDGENIYLLCPANRGREADDAGFSRSGWCTFHTKQGLCELHELGLKPVEGRFAHHEDSPSNLHEEVAMTWNNPEAQQLVEDWRVQMSMR